MDKERPVDDVSRLGREQAVDIILALLVARDATRAPDPVATIHVASNVARELTAGLDLEALAAFFGEDAPEEFRQALVKRVDHIVDLADDILPTLLRDGGEAAS